MNIRELKSKTIMNFMFDMEDEKNDKSYIEKEFIKELSNSGTPLIEEIPNDNKNVLVTFVYVSSEEIDNVLLLSGITPELTEENKEECSLENIKDTNIWFKSYVVANDIRFMYYFFPNDSLNIDCEDRWNKMTIDNYNNNKLMWDENITYSYAIMPYSKKDEYLKENASKGTLVNYKVEDKHMKKTRNIVTYLPFDYDFTSRDYNYIVINDGEDYIKHLSVKNILDNLIDENLIESTIAILVESTDDRHEEYSCNEKYCKFISDDLIKWLNKELRVKDTRESRTIAGLSLGGLTSSFVALKYSNVFSKVLAQSGSFWFEPTDYKEKNNRCWLSREYKKANIETLDVYLDVGTLECKNVMQKNVNDMYDVLKEKGHTVKLKYFRSGHDYLSWGQSFAEGLKHLLRND